ncbi:Catalase [Durusdinium trenchii]|uniref:Catalase n=1 Tax=Durusdinium trenchii TaxID=1381693 RepID=A0ABP0LJF1_9DINO
MGADARGLGAVIVGMTAEPWTLVTNKLAAALWAAPIFFLGNIWTVLWIVMRLPALKSRLENVKTTLFASVALSSLLLTAATAAADDAALTQDSGAPVVDNQNSKTAGEFGGVLLEDFHLIEKLARFDRERIPERVVHARGTGAGGEFVVTNTEIAKYTAASLFEKRGKKTPVFVRFSTVVHPKGSPEGLRDPRGFATKFYTDEGNWDLVGNNLPVFFIRDAIKFPDMVHSLKPSPITNQQDPNRFFDFFSHIPESTHMLTQVYTDLGTPAGYPYMDGNSVHALRLVDDEGNVVFAKFRWKSQQGVKTLTAEEANAKPFNYATKGLYDSLAAGDYPKWDLHAIILKPEDIDKLDFNPFDATKDWAEEGSVFTTVKIGTMTLNEMPENFFSSTEQSAFSPGVLVPGIEASPDRLLQGRLFSYADTQRYRLGANYQSLPVNAPHVTIRNGNQDGFMNALRQRGDVNYQPSRKSHDNTYTDSLSVVAAHYDVSGVAQKAAIQKTLPFRQAGEFYRSLDDGQKTNLISNLAGDLGQVRDPETKEIMVSHFYLADEEYGRRLAEAVNVAISSVEARAGAVKQAALR